jgi:DNA-binding transcriptional LysR family regulator
MPEAEGQWGRRMDIRSLQQVIAVRRHGSFARAADALGVSQPNLSKRVARLEDELKLKLFDRTAKGSVLTPIGELLVERADAVIAETRDLARDASLLAGGEMGTVRIGVTTVMSEPLLNPIVQRIAKRHPNLGIHAEAAASGRLIPLLDARELDVVVTGHAPPNPAAPAYVVYPVLETPALWVVSPDHPLARERGISVARLAEFKCGGGHSAGSNNAGLLGFESENLVKYTASRYDTVLPLVLSGEAAVLAPAFVVQPYLETGEMVVVDVQWRLDVKFHFVTTRAASHSPIVVEIGEHARSIGSQLHDEWRSAGDRFMPR